MNLKDIKEFLYKRKGYLKFGKNALAKQLGIKNTELCAQAIREVKDELNNYVPGITMMPQNTPFNTPQLNRTDVFKNNFKLNTDILTGDFKSKKFNYATIKVKKNVLVVGDLHLPFTLDGYLEHCIKVYKKYNCDTVVFIGDILDLHFTSYHETSTEGYGATQEHD